jgi:porphobilinogen synthase
MPGVFQLSVDEAVKEATAAKNDGVPGVLLFGLPDQKDVVGSTAYDPEGPVQSAVRAIKQENPALLVDHRRCLVNTHHTDTAASSSTTRSPTMSTVEQLARTALSHAGRAPIRRAVRHDGRPRRRDPLALDDAGSTDGDHVLRAKYCSAFYGRFREPPIGAAVRRSPIAPDGSGQRRRGAARGRARHRRRRRHRHGQAGAAYLDVIAR